MSSQKSSVFVTFLIKQKSKSPSAASRGKKAQRKKFTASDDTSR